MVFNMRVFKTKDGDITLNVNGNTYYGSEANKLMYKYWELLDEASKENRCYECKNEECEVCLADDNVALNRFADYLTENGYKEVKN